jgi:Ca2+-binding EF-hand superfamily protein
MRSHPQSRPMDHDEADMEQHLIHLTSFVDVIIPKLVHRAYPSASESDLLKYLKRLDQTNKNYLHKKLFIQTMSSMEDALGADESAELAVFFNENDALAIENLPDFFDYKRYAKHLLPERHRIYLDLLARKPRDL